MTKQNSINGSQIFDSKGYGDPEEGVANSVGTKGRSNKPGLGDHGVSGKRWKGILCERKRMCKVPEAMKKPQHV